MKKVILMLLTLLCLATVTTALADGSCGDNLTWTLDNGTLTISGTGATDEWAPLAYAPWYSQRSRITNVVVEEGCTELGAYAFYYCTNLKTVTLPEGLRSIGKEAFSICSKLQKLTIPASVESIGEPQFALDRGLTSIDVAPGSQKYMSRDGALFSKDGTRLIAFPAGRTGTYTVPSGVTELAEDAFNSSDLRSIKLPAGLTTIGETAFQYCNKIQNLTLPASVKTIGKQAFQGGIGLRAIYVGRGSKYFSSHDGVLFNQDKTELICFPHGAQLKTYTVPEGVRRIGDYAFVANYTLEQVILPEGLESVGEYAFAYLNLTELTLPASLKEIDRYGFHAQYKLESVTIPASVVTVGEDAFSYSGNLTRVTVEGMNTQFKGYTVFGFGSNALEIWGHEGSTAQSHARLQKIDFKVIATEADTWICPECSSTMSSNFCWKCGTSRPPKAQECKRCAYTEPEELAGQMKFCPECGTKFD